MQEEGEEGEGRGEKRREKNEGGVGVLSPDQFSNYS